MTVQQFFASGQALRKWAQRTGWLGVAVWLMALAPAQAQAQVFSENFGTCAGTGATEPADTALALNPPIQVRLYSAATASCTGWTYSGPAWLAESTGGTQFPGGASKAIWLNETNGRISRTLSGLTVGHTYRLSAQAWTDNVNAPTALRVEFGPVSTMYAMAAGSGPQNVGVRVCATTTSLDMSLYESGSTESSPLVTNIRVDDLNTPCGTAVVPTSAPTPVPVSSPWMWALLCGLVCWVVARGGRLSRSAR